jgi:hypothetical protein
MGLKHGIKRIEWLLALLLAGQVVACLAWLTCMAMGDLALDKSGLGDFGVFSRWQVRSHVALAGGVTFYALSMLLAFVRRRGVGPSADWTGWRSVAACVILPPLVWFFSYVVFLIVSFSLAGGGE